MRNLNYYYDAIWIKIALQDISTEHFITNPDITLRYFYRKTPLPPDYYTDGGGRVERFLTVLDSGRISFRKWDQEAGILSGNFNFDCSAPQHDGCIKHISVTRGNFDVKIDK